jgi:ATP-dependent Clp protease ATP-binding subunit ClpB
VRIQDGALIAAATLSDKYLPARKLPDKAVDLVDEACASVRVTRETSPEEIDKLERRKLELEVEIHALEREKDQASKDRLDTARKNISDVNERLTPLRAAWENEKSRGDEVANLRRKIDELKAKADEAERRYDLSTASDLRYFAIPDAQNRLQQIEKTKADQMDAGEGSDVVTAEQIAEIVARWTSQWFRCSHFTRKLTYITDIPVTRLLSTEKEKLLTMEKTLAASVVGQPEAVKAVANAIRLSRSGLRNTARPIA